MRLVPLGSFGECSSNRQDWCTAGPFLDVEFLAVCLGHLRFGQRLPWRLQGARASLSDGIPEGVGWRAEWRHLSGIGCCAESEQKYGGGPYPSDLAGCGCFERRNGPVAPVVQRRSSSVQSSKWALSVPIQTRFKLLAGGPGPTSKNSSSLLPKAGGPRHTSAAAVVGILLETGWHARPLRLLRPLRFWGPPRPALRVRVQLVFLWLQGP